MSIVMCRSLDRDIKVGTIVLRDDCGDTLFRKTGKDLPSAPCNLTFFEPLLSHFFQPIRQTFSVHHLLDVDIIQREFDNSE